MFKFKTPNQSTGFLLWKAHNLWQREIKKMLKKHNLTHTQFVILASTIWLSKRNKKLTQVEIANHIEIDKMLTSNVLRTLEKNGFIKRKEHKTDTRAKIIKPTGKGIDLLERVVKEVEEFDSTFFSKLEQKEDFNLNLLNLMK